jgi:hypothetical protein
MADKAVQTTNLPTRKLATGASVTAVAAALFQAYGVRWNVPPELLTPDIANLIGDLTATALGGIVGVIAGWFIKDVPNVPEGWRR